MSGSDPSNVPPLSQGIPLNLVPPMLATALLQTFSQAILFTQLYTYLSSARVSRPISTNRESRWKVAYVLLVSSLSAAQTGRYIYLVHLGADEQIDPLTVRSIWLEPLFYSIIGCLVRLFFIYRTYRMHPRWLLAAPLLTAQAAILASQIWLTTKVFNHFEKRIIVAGDLAFDLSITGALVLDIVLAVILCVCILRSRTGIDYLDRFLGRIVLLLWSCAVPPVLFMIPAVVIYHVVPTRVGSIWCGCCLALSTKLYCHSLMRSLNSRDRLKGKLQQEREHFNSSEARRAGQDDSAGSQFSRTSSNAGTAKCTTASADDSGHTRYSSQTTVYNQSPNRSRFPAPKSLAQIDEPQELADLGYYPRNPKEVVLDLLDLEFAVTRSEED